MLLKTPEEVIVKEGTGVIVARFQCSELTEGHKALLDSVIERHNKTICVIGLSAIKASKNNPLDFEARRKMVAECYPNIQIVYIKDAAENPRWSKNLDDIISTNTPPNSKVVLYGSRDCFIGSYTGNYKTQELLQETFVSGTADRTNNAFSVSDSTDFRKGVIWATQNQYDTCHPAVDIAIVDNATNRVLMARKPHETKYRFVGGFVDPRGNAGEPKFFETNAKREVNEETHVETDNYIYLGSFLVDDWRYRSERSKIVTTLFKADYVFGKPQPDDDIEILQWFIIEDLKTSEINDIIVKEHIPLMTRFLADY